MRPALGAFAACALSLTALEYPDQPKYLSIPTQTSVRPISLTARRIERGLQYPSIIYLKGEIEIRTPICVRVGPDHAQYCDGYVVLRADEADFHEDSGQVEARGQVTVTREK